MDIETRYNEGNEVYFLYASDKGTDYIDVKKGVIESIAISVSKGSIFIHYKIRYESLDKVYYFIVSESKVFNSIKGLAEGLM